MADTYPDDERLRVLIEQAMARVLPSAKVGADVGMVLTPVYPPLVSVPEATKFLMARDIVSSFVLAGGQVLGQAVQTDEPTIVYAISASARNPATALAVPLENFEVQLRQGNERYVSDPVLLSSFAGTPGSPRLVGGRGWQWFDTSSLTCTVGNLQAAVATRCDITFHCFLLR